MSEAIDRPPQEVIDEGVRDTSGLGGHPAGLTTLFFAELWERFSYYGMRAILVLYMVAPEAQGGLGFDPKQASAVYGSYIMWVYLTALPGGLVADRWLGARLAVLVGGVIIACGHFTMVFQSTNALYAGMALIAIGTGLLKPNISAMVGGLYRENDARRDSGFSLFYMGINVGAVLAPLVCGYLAQSEGFKSFLAARGFDPAASWHWGFGAAGVGMLLGLAVFVLQRGRLRQAEQRMRREGPKEEAVMEAAGDRKLTSGDWKRIGAIFIFFLFTILFWAAYEQKGASLNLFAAKLVRTEVFGYAFPSSWLQSLTPFFVIILAPLFAHLWVRMGDRQPSSPAKFALGMLSIGLAFLLFMTPAAWLSAGGRVSPLWLVGLYFLEVVGEMCLSPVGLSTVTKLSPLKLVGIMMGVWFLASSFGGKLAGYLSGFFVAESPETLVRLYGGIAVGLLVATGLLALLVPTLRRLMGHVR